MSEDKEQLTVRMPKSLHKALKGLCVEEEIAMNDAANEAIKEWIAKRKSKKAEEEQPQA